MLILNPRKYQQKIKQWGNLSDVRSAVFRNTEKLGIDPASIVGYWPLWEKSLSPVNLITGSFGSEAGSAISADDNGLYINNTGSGNADLTVDGYSFTDNTAFWFAFGAKQPTYTTDHALVAGYDNNTALDYIGLYGGSYLRVRFSTSLLFTNITDFTEWTNLAVRCNGTDTANIDAFQDGENKQTLTAGNSALKLNHFGLINSSYGAEDTYISYWMAGSGDITDDQIATLHEQPYALLQPAPQPIIFDVGAAGTTYSVTCADGISAGDTPTKRAIFSAACTDGMQAGDSDSSIANLTATLADALSLSDSAAKTLAMSLTVADGVTFSDSSLASLLGNLQAECSDGVVLSESISAVANLLATAADGLSLEDSALWGGILSAIAADGISLSDSAARALRLLMSCADGVTLSDYGTTTVNFSATCADGVEFAETLAAVMRFAASCSDGFEVSDSPAIPVGSTAYRTVSVTFGVKQSTITFSVRRPNISFTVN